MREPVTVIGAGLAGCEAAWQIAAQGVPVTLIEMKPKRYSPAHKSEDFCELVCSNSLRADDLSVAVGLLKEEMRRLNSLVIRTADQYRVPAGGALAVDRTKFSSAVTEQVKNHPLIDIRYEEAAVIPEKGLVVVATGPLTDGMLAEDIRRFFGGSEYLHFFDAAAPVVTRESIDDACVYAASRYGKGEGEGDYLNCPLSKEQYERFTEELAKAEEAPVHGFEDSMVFEGCMPVEVMARRGPETLRHGPMKPMGLRDPSTGHLPWAVVQLRRDNAEGTLYNMVGFQTHLKWGEQKRVFSMIPALAQAEFVRLGVMHRNSYLCAPRLLDRYYRARIDRRVAFAGQITGVEGYVESAASGLYAGLNMGRAALGKPLFTLPEETAIGALAQYISSAAAENFQPMNINFGLLPPCTERSRGRREKKLAVSRLALSALEEAMKQLTEPETQSPGSEGIGCI